MKKADIERDPILLHRRTMEINYPEIGICGLSCRLCPMHATDAASRCEGCKSESRMAVGCPFITCAVKRRGIEFCWDCHESAACERWAKHRKAGTSCDSFKCYQTLEQDIAYIETHGVVEFEKTQIQRGSLLEEMLSGFNDGRSKSYYCIAATVLDLVELRGALAQAGKDSDGLTVKEKAKRLHAILDTVAAKRGYPLKLRR